ncbi:MAG: IS630 family transposase [Eubacteriaceae bacterium]|nr:IS630 family transposase [Eubacteriaceae bacterium]
MHAIVPFTGEDILDLYEQPYDESAPVVCMDEKPFQLLGEAREPLPMEPGKPKRPDSEYTRNGTCSIFVFTEPLSGFRHVHARERRTKVDWAIEIAHLLTSLYPDAPKIRLVMDNLNTHCISSLYEEFGAETARAYAKRLEIHYTPKHGSWLNIAEIELSKQCLKERSVCIEALNEQLAAWEASKNANQKGVGWHFTTGDAREKLKRLCPIVP